MIRAVLLDLDDTLLDHSSAAAGAVVAWAGDRGLPGSADELVARWTEVSDRHYRRYQVRDLTFAEQRRERAREFLGIEVSDAGADQAFAGYLTHYEARWRAFPDARPAVERIRQAGLTPAVLTNGDSDHQALKLKRVGLDDLDLRMFASSDFPAGKPDRRAFLGTCAILGVAPSEALMVGDSLTIDVQGALDAGLQAVLVDRHDRHPGIPGRIRSLDELLTRQRPT